MNIYVYIYIYDMDVCVYTYIHINIHIYTYKCTGVSPATIPSSSKSTICFLYIIVGSSFNANCQIRDDGCSVGAN
jgi:hypothetical protein